MASGYDKKLPMILNQYDLPEDIDGVFKANCKHCGIAISGCIAVTTNFIRHVRRKHPSINIHTSLNMEETELLHLTSLIEHPCKVYNSDDPRQISTTDALVTFIAGDLMAVSIVESVNFKKLVNTLDPRYQMPCRKHLSNTLLKAMALEFYLNL